MKISNISSPLLSLQYFQSRYHDPVRWNKVFYDYFASRLEDNVDLD